MKNLIYQCWAGELRDGCKYSQKLFKEYDGFKIIIHQTMQLKERPII